MGANEALRSCCWMRSVGFAGVHSTALHASFAPKQAFEDGEKAFPPQ
jgi:hypothetical protein